MNVEFDALAIAWRKNVKKCWKLKPGSLKWKSTWSENHALLTRMGDITQLGLADLLNKLSEYK